MDMHLMLAYPVAAGAGVLIAHFVSRAPELRFMRLSQLILVPAAMVLCVYVSSEIGGLPGLICFVAVLGLLVGSLGKMARDISLLASFVLTRTLSCSGFQARTDFSREWLLSFDALWTRGAFLS